MIRKPNARITRPPLDARPWLSPSLYDIMTSKLVLHADVYGKSDQFGFTYFMIEYRVGGKELVAVDYIRAELDGLVICAPTYGLIPAFWTRATANVFSRCHHTILRYCMSMIDRIPGITRVAPQFHYIRVIDGDPWPRGFVNYKTHGGSGPAPTRARRSPAEMERAREEARALLEQSPAQRFSTVSTLADADDTSATLPDWL